MVATAETAVEGTAMANGTSTTTAADTLEENALKTLLDIVRTSASPEVAQAQAIMLRRLALEGDVVGSRIPAPTTITEVGGYINLLGDLGQPEMRAQMLAGALGVSGPNPPLGWLPTQPVVGWVTITNDRPACAGQASIPLTITLRGDFAPPLQAVIKGLHDQGCALPLATAVPALPPAGGTTPTNLLPLLGREISIAPGAALADPDNDPIAVARKGTDPYQVVARVISPGTVAVASDAWEALKCTTATCTPVAPPGGGRPYVALAPLLANAGFYPVTGATPASLTDRDWARFTNVTGLVPGQTTLADELTLLYSQSEIAMSGLGAQLTDVWNGTTFASP
jgi:hypothetical protein